MADDSAQGTILLVEDNPHDADLTRIGFRRNHIRIPLFHVRDGEEAVDYLFATGRYQSRDVRDLPIAIILDLKLPKVSGLEVLKAVRENELTRNVPVIILSSSNEAQDTATARQLGVTAYVQKPVSFKEFEQAVKIIADVLNGLSAPAKAST